jgi:hypothetical protein
VSLVVTGGVALAYTVGVVGVHRYTVWRRRAKAGNYPALDWLDWDTLFAGLWPSSLAAPQGKSPKEGGPAPRCLSTPPPAGREAAAALLQQVIDGVPNGAATFEQAGFSGGEARWLAELSAREAQPRAVLERLASQPPVSAAEAYFFEWLSLRLDVTPLTVEWEVYAIKRRLAAAMHRFGDVPALYFARAHASALLGFTQSVIDDLGRAVFFAREAPFYVDAVLAMPFVQELRPPLGRACREAKARMTRPADLEAGNDDGAQDRLDDAADRG